MRSVNIWRNADKLARLTVMVLSAKSAHLTIGICGIAALAEGMAIVMSAILKYITSNTINLTFLLLVDLQPGLFNLHPLYLASRTSKDFASIYFFSQGFCLCINNQRLDSNSILFIYIFRFASALSQRLSEKTNCPNTRPCR